MPTHPQLAREVAHQHSGRHAVRGEDQGMEENPVDWGLRWFSVRSAQFRDCGFLRKALSVTHVSIPVPRNNQRFRGPKKSYDGNQ